MQVSGLYVMRIVREWANNTTPGTLQGLLDGQNNVFTMSQSPASSLASVRIYRNGMYLTPPLDCNINGRTLTLTIPPAPTDTLTVEYEVAWSIPGIG